MEEFIDGTTVTATGFADSLGKFENLPLAHVVYAFDQDDGQTILLEHSKVTYLGDKMGDSLANLIQSEEYGIHMDLRPRKYYPDDDSCQSITLEDGTKIPILYDGVLPYIPVRRPTPFEIENCPRIALTSRDLWDPSLVNASFTQSSVLHHVNMQHLTSTIDYGDPISANLMSTGLDVFLSQSPLITMDSLDDPAPDANIKSINSFKQASLSATESSNLWHIGLETAKRTLNAITHNCIRSTGMLGRRYKTDKSQLRYKQLTRRYGTFYVDFLKTGITSVRQFIGGTLYTNKTGFKKFFPCTNETSEQTAHTLRSFIELVGLPASLHSDNHRNFKDCFSRDSFASLVFTALTLSPTPLGKIGLNRP